MSKLKILFIQGGGKGAHEIDQQLANNLTVTLSKTHEIIYPKIPREDDPDYKSWSVTFDGALKKITGPVILVGHSVGGYLLLKYLIEKKIENDLKGIFFLAIPFVGDGGWQFEDGVQNDFASKLPSVPIFFYQSDDDEIVPPEHLNLYASKVPAATVRKIAGRGHQFNNNLTEIIEDIRTLK